MLLPKVCLLFFAFTHALGSNYSLVKRDKKMEEIVARKRPSLLLTLEVSDLAMATKNWDLDGNARDIRLPINKGGKLRWFSRKLGICKVRWAQRDFFQSFWNHCEPLEPMQLAKCLWQQHDTLPSWQKQCCQAIRFAFKSLDNEKKMLMNRCTVQGSPTAPPFFCTTSRSFSIECSAFAGANYYGTGWQVSHKSQGSNIWQKSETLALCYCFLDCLFWLLVKDSTTVKRGGRGGQNHSVWKAPRKGLILLTNVKKRKGVSNCTLKMNCFWLW